MSDYLVVPASKDVRKRLENAAGGRKIEDVAAEAIVTFLDNREDAARRAAEAGFLFTRRNRAR